MKSMDCILENYNTVCGEYNHEAIMAVRNLVVEGKTNFSPLVIYGDVGVGKTHILNVARAYLKMNDCDNNSIIYFANNGLCKFLNDSLNNNEFHKSIDFGTTSLIILDDVHEYAHMVRTQEVFLDIISKSQELNIPIIVAGNNHPKAMPNGFNPNLLSRLGGGVAVRIDVPDIKSKASFIGMLTKRKGIILEPKIEEKVIEYFGSDFSMLQGVINRFELFATSHKSTVIDHVAFDLIFRDEINYLEKPVPRNGESV